MNKSETIVELAKAMSSFQGAVKQPMKDKENPFFKSKYVPLESVVEAINETAPKFGLSFMQFPTEDENGRTGIITLVMHTSGEFIESNPFYMKPEKFTPQGIGSTQTYLKRYSLSAMFGITSDQDDDGNVGSGNMNQQAQQKQKPATKAEMDLLNKKSDELAELYELDVKEMKQKMGISEKMGQVDFKMALKRVTDGIMKFEADKKKAEEK